MRHLLISSLILISSFSFSQNFIQVNNLNYRNNNVQQQRNGNQTVQYFATNKPVQRTVARNTNLNSPAQSNKVNTPQINRSNQSRQRAQSQQVNPVVANEQIQLVNQTQAQNYSNIDERISDNNVGIGNIVNLNNIETAQEVGDVPFQAIGVANNTKKNFSMNLNFKKLDIGHVKLVTKASSKSSCHKSFSFKKKFSKLNRKMHSKLSSVKKIKLKVDLCCNWS